MGSNRKFAVKIGKIPMIRIIMSLAKLLARCLKKEVVPASLVY